MLGKGLGAGNWSGLRHPIIQPPVDIVVARGYDQYPVVPLSRATTATYRAADGTIKTAAPNSPRYDWSTGTRALLIEAAATNLFSHASDFGVWVRDNLIVTANAQIAPDGTLSADHIAGTTAVDHHRVKKTGISVTAQSYCASIYAKSQGRNLRITLFDGSGAWSAVGQFNLAAGTAVVIGGATMLGVGITPVGGGWYRCWLRANAVAASNNAQVLINLTAPNDATQYADDGVSGVALWGAQLEAGTGPTSFIPTESSAVTRAADIVAPIDLSGFDLSGGYTVVVKGRLDGVAGAWDRLIQLDAGTNANRQSVVYNRAQSRLRAEVWSGNAASSMTEASAPLPFEARCAFAIAPDSFDYAQNGVVSPHDDTVVYVQPSWMRLGVDISGAQTPARLLIYSVTLYPAVMTAAQLEEITA